MYNNANCGLQNNTNKYMFNLAIIKKKMHIKARWLLLLIGSGTPTKGVDISSEQEGGQAIRGCIVCREFKK